MAVIPFTGSRGVIVPLLPKQKIEVVRKAEEDKEDFLLLDSRSLEAFASGHIRGAWCMPREELAALAGNLPQNQELVIHCWNDF